MSKPKFCHLHVHTEYSLLDGLGKINQYVERAVKLGYRYLAITDHANISGVIKFQKKCDEVGIKPIIGCEFYIVNNFQQKTERYHILSLIKDSTGWANVTKMLTIANIDMFYKKPLIDFDTYLKYCDGLITTTACSSSFIYAKGFEYFLESLIAKNKKDVICEVMPIAFEKQKQHNRNILELAKKYDLMVIATNDCHYPFKENVLAHEVLLAIQTKKKWHDNTRWKFEATDLFLKSEEEMYESFYNFHSYISKEDVYKFMCSTIDVAETCNFKLEKKQVFLPSLPEIANENDEYNYLLKLSKQGLIKIRKRISGRYSEYYNRMLYELEIIKKLNFVRYFLLIYDIVNYCKSNDIPIGYGRGSSAGSLVAYLIGITGVDPIKYNLYFERFISPDRINLPDFDIDFADNKRHLVREYIESKYGKFNVAGIVTFLEMKDKMVFRDVCRVFDIPLSEVNYISKFLSSDGNNSDFKIAFDSINECIKFKQKYPHIIDICCQLESQIRGIGRHAAGVVIVEDLRNSNLCNLMYVNNALTINWDKEDAEYVGMLKVDILGLSNLSIVHYTKDLIRERRNIDVDLSNIDVDDKNVLTEFANGNCVGIFQFWTNGMRELCKKLQIDSFDLLTHAVALYRPATLRNGMVDVFIANRFKHIVDNHSVNNIMKSVLSDTYGIIVYQEQIMKIVVSLAGLSFSDADKIRKLLDNEDKDSLMKYKHKFIVGCMRNNINRIDAINIWNILLSHGNYSFNKAHAVSYSLLSYANMYLKCYFPAEFLCANLTFCSKEKKNELIKEARRLGFEIILPDIENIGDAFRWTIKENKLIAPLIEINGIGEKMALNIVKRDNFFKKEKDTKALKILRMIYQLKKEKKYNELSKYFSFDVL